MINCAMIICAILDATICLRRHTYLWHIDFWNPLFLIRNFNTRAIILACPDRWIRCSKMSVPVPIARAIFQWDRGRLSEQRPQ